MFEPVSWKVKERAWNPASLDDFMALNGRYLKRNLESGSDIAI